MQISLNDFSFIKTYIDYKRQLLRDATEAEKSEIIKHVDIFLYRKFIFEEVNTKDVNLIDFLNKIADEHIIRLLTNPTLFSNFSLKEFREKHLTMLVETLEISVDLLKLCECSIDTLAEKAIDNIFTWYETLLPQDDKREEKLLLLEIYGTLVHIFKDHIPFMDLAYNFFKHVYKNEDFTLTIKILIMTLPQLLKYQNEENQVEILQFAYDLSIRDRNELTIISILADYCYKRSILLGSILNEREHFWDFLYNTLMDKNSSDRKKAYILLRRAIQWQTSMTEDIKFLTDDQWKDFFVLIEVLEEKQVHVVKPVLNKLDNFISLAENDSNRKWLLLLYHRIFRHPSRSVALWGLEHFMNLPDPVLQHLLRSFEKILLPQFLLALNDGTLFVRTGPLGSLPPLAEQLGQFLSKLAELDAGRGIVVERLLRQLSLASRPWGSVPLLYLSYSLAQLPRAALLQPRCSDFIRSILWPCQNSQEIIIRGATQGYLLTAFLNLFNWESWGLKDLANWALLFNSKEADVVKPLSARLSETPNNLLHYLSTPDLTPAHAKMAAVLATLDRTTFLQHLAELSKSLVSAPMRPYHSPIVSLRHLLLLLEELPGDNSVLEIALPAGTRPDFVTYCGRHLLNAATNFPELEAKSSYLKILRHLIHLDATLELNAYLDIVSQLQEDQISCYPSLWHFLSLAPTTPNTDVRRLLELVFQHPPSGELVKPHFVQNPEQHTQWSHWASSALAGLWSAIQAHLEPGPRVVVLAQTCLPLASSTAVAAILRALQASLPLLGAATRREYLKYTWDACLELHRSEIFRPTLAIWFQLAFQPDILTQDPESLSSYWAILSTMSESSPVILHSLLEHLHSLPLSLAPTFLPQLLTGLIFGPVFRKDQRVLNDATAFVICNTRVPEQLLVHWIPSVRVRVQALHLLLSLPQPVRSQLLTKLLADLLDCHNQEKGSNRCHAGSLRHRQQTRAWQTIVMLLPSMPQDTLIQLCRTACGLLAQEGLQTSVSHLLEWVIALICLQQPDCHSYIRQQLKECTRPSLATSLLTVAILLVQSGTLGDQDRFRWRSLALPWCMAQNYSCRLHGQLLMRRSLGSGDLAGQLMMALESPAATAGNSGRNLIKLQKDFFLSFFHPLHHHTLQTIFWEIPRLTSLPDDEWISVDDLRTLEDLSPVPLLNPEPGLAACHTTQWSTSTRPEEEENVDQPASVFQKKIAPWSESAPLLERQARKTGELIVVASLIDKAPNLGGLCRTCEVFGVASLVVGNAKLTQDPQFTSLAVSAERWVDVVEVRPSKLREFLLDKRQQGYSLVGLEQVPESQSLHTFSFPQRCLLLLGHEREGLPAWLLHLMDWCVQIPQLGLTRSLNVHVSGALAVWEYCRQHLL